MNYKNFLNMVILMRNAQKDFFLSHKPSDMKRAKQYERQVDQMIKQETKGATQLTFTYTVDDDENTVEVPQ